MSKLLEATISVEEYIDRKIDELNNNVNGHEWVCIGFNKSKWQGKALCVTHKKNSFREYTNL